MKKIQRKEKTRLVLEAERATRNIKKEVPERVMRSHDSSCGRY